MRKRRRKTLLSTSVGVYLSLNVQVQKDNNHPGLLTFPLLNLTTLLLWWWALQSGLGQARQLISEIQVWAAVQQQQISLALTVFNIGIRSLLYGAGLPV